MITINAKNRTKIASAIDAAQDGAKVRTITVEDVFHLAEQSEDRLARESIPQRLRQGVEVYDHPHEVGRSYGHTAYGTSIRIVRRSAAWALVEVTRTYTNERPVNRLTFPSGTEADVTACLLSAARFGFAAAAVEVAA